ncbi:amino acid-binding protein [Diaminobutyricimonas sp. LJ205]|uniref:amino acid-binding protein n=1 Tax=Diaminobutyricimonas sp. LJ205 TaxID=2683590 RepID=UPI0012F488B1|nr:amino acid-binding protein [Diaminobutyricimonas sp. LJ205]
MAKNTRTTPTDDLLCDVCGRLPEPAKTRLTLANVATILPIELLVHALVVNTPLPYLAKVAVLAITATVLVIWIAEPSAARLLRSFLHAPALNRRRRIEGSAAIWRARTTIVDEPGALQRLTRALSRENVNILSIHSHLVAQGVLNEFVLESPEAIGEARLTEILERGGGKEVGVFSSTALALADGQTRALSIAARVAADPGELRLAVADLLGAGVVRGEAAQSAHADDRTLLKIPTALGEPMVFGRPGEPFTVAESARANRLAELAEAVQGAATNGSVPKP